MDSRTLVNLTMHPIRARLLYVLGRRELTTQQIVHELPDISQASVYRHVRLLAKSGLLRVVREVPVRGISERVYAFDIDEATAKAHEMPEQTPADFLRYFQIFVNALLDQYRLYSLRDDADPRTDGVAFWGEVLYLSRQEHQELIQELLNVTHARRDNAPSADRTRFHISRILIPDKTPPAPDADSDQDDRTRFPERKLR